MESVVTRDISQGNLLGYLAGDQDKATVREGHTVGGGGGDSGGM